MLSAGRARGLAARAAIVTLTGALMIAGAQYPASAKPPKPKGTSTVPTVAGLAPVAAPAVTPPKALPRRSGSVPLDAASAGAANGAKSSASASTLSGGVSAMAATTDQVGLRALVIAVSSADYGLPTWQATLDRVGAAYDVLYSSTTPLTAETLLRADGAGKYNAILLTDSMQLYVSNGAYVAGFDTTEWNVLWAYERTYGVRQATLFSSYGSWPEDDRTRAVSETSIGDTAVNVAMTSVGASIFDYLNSAAQIPLVQTYMYRTTIALGCSADPIITAGSDVVGVRSTSTDGRERIALTFSNNQYLTQSNLLVYGLFRWASKGLFLGQQRHYLNVDVDDWFNTYDRRNVDGTIDSSPNNRTTSAEAANLAAKQVSLRAAYPLASGLTYNLAYNGGDADGVTTGACAADGTSVNLTATTRCLASQFRFLNHTYNHPELNFTDYATSYAELNNNRTVATALGLPEAANVVKTPEYSGLGVYNPNPTNDIDPPTDYGLAASNANFLAAAKALGTTYVHGNMSFTSHKPSCFNCSIVHPMESTISVVADWPTNIAYFSSTPDEETAFYNWYYGPTGKFPFWSRNLTYAEVMDYEAGQALNQLATGSINSHTFHIANARDYGSGQTVLTDWTGQVLAKYSAYYAVPLLNTDWSTLGAYTTTRNAHFAQVAAGADAVYDRTTGTVVITSTLAGSLQVTGATATGSVLYGTDNQSLITLTAATPVTVTAAPRS